VIDFNEELARATLLEHPNSFFVGTAATEDVDSDSGYSSPQHRQTTAAPSESAAATAAVCSPPVVIPPSPQPTSRALETPHSVQQSAVMTYMPDGRQFPMIYAPYPFQGPPSVNMFTPNVAGDSARLQSSNHRGTGSKGRYRGSGKRKAPKELQSDTPKSLMSNQATSVNGGVSSPMTVCNEPALPFDDVDEFPYLLSAADGLIASQVASIPHPTNQPSTCRRVEVI